MQKRTGCIIICAVTLAFLSACSREPSPEDMSLIMRERYSGAASIVMNASVTADYGERTYAFKLRYACENGEGSVTVLEPETISGIEARFTDGGAEIVYDGAEIFTGKLSGDGLSPVSALPTAVSLWRTGLITECSFVDSDLLLIFRITDNVTLATLFDSETYLPIRAEITSDGFTVIYMEFENVVI